MFQMTIPARDPDQQPAVAYKDPKTLTDAKWIESLALRREPRLRVATPDKRVIHDMSQSFEKHRLGKQQRMLQDLNLRCRVQEVSDMSGGLTKKLVTQSSVDEQSSALDGCDADTTTTDDTGPMFDRTLTKFPPTRRVLKSPRKFSGMPAVSLPQLNIEHCKGLSKKPLDLALNKASLIKDGSTLQINGRVQIDHYIHDKQNMLSPLTLPNIKRLRSKHSKDRIDSYVLTKKANLHPKGMQRSQWELWSRQSERNPPTAWNANAQIMMPPTSQSARN